MINATEDEWSAYWDWYETTCQWDRDYDEEAYWRQEIEPDAYDEMGEYA